MTWWISPKPWSFSWLKQRLGTSVLFSFPLDRFPIPPIGFFSVSFNGNHLKFLFYISSVVEGIDWVGNKTELNAAYCCIRTSHPPQSLSISGYSGFFLSGHENCECYLFKCNTTLSGGFTFDLLQALTHLKKRTCPPGVSLDVPLFGLNYCLMGFLMVPHVRVALFGTFLSHTAFTPADSRVMKKVESPVRCIS